MLDVLTPAERQDRFAIEYVNSLGDGTAAALAAGYAESTAKSGVSTLLKHPRVAARIAVELEQQRTVSGVIAVTVLQRIAKGETYPAAARVTAARTLAEYAGLIGNRPADASNKDPSEMSADELRDLIARLDRELGDRAKPVNAPDSTPIDDQLSDFL